MCPVWLDSNECALIALGSTHSVLDCVVNDCACSADRLWCVHSVVSIWGVHTQCLQTIVSVYSAISDPKEYTLSDFGLRCKWEFTSTIRIHDECELGAVRLCCKCGLSAARLRGVLTQGLYILVSQSELSYLRFYGGFGPRAVGHCCEYSVLLRVWAVCTLGVSILSRIVCALGSVMLWGVHAQAQFVQILWSVSVHSVLLDSTVDINSVLWEQSHNIIVFPIAGTCWDSQPFQLLYSFLDSSFCPKALGGSYRKDRLRRPGESCPRCVATRPLMRSMTASGTASKRRKRKPLQVRALATVRVGERHGGCIQKLNHCSIIEQSLMRQPNKNKDT